MTASLVRADSIAIPLKDDSVDLIITSPPYFALRSYTDGGEHYHGQIGSEPTPQDFLEALWAVTAECKRVLKPSGSMWVNLGDKMNEKCLMGLPWRYAIGCIDELDLILRAEVIWSKPNGLPESVTDRVRRSHEQWFHFTKEPRYFAAVDEVREAHAAKTLTHRGGGQAHGNHRNPDNNFGSDKPRTIDPLGKLPGSVWTIPSEPLKVPEHIGVDHFAAFPQEWPRRIILGWSPSGVCTVCGEGRRPVVDLSYTKDSRDAVNDDLQWRVHPATRHTQPSWGGHSVATITGYACACPDTTAPTKPAVILDPFAGTGTVPMVARALGRFGIGIDLSNDYLRLAKWRVFQSGHAAKTRERTNREAQGELL